MMKLPRDHSRPRSPDHWSGVAQGGTDVLGGRKSDDGKVKRISDVLNRANCLLESEGGELPGEVLTLLPMIVSL